MKIYVTLGLLLLISSRSCEETSTTEEDTQHTEEAKYGPPVGANPSYPGNGEPVPGYPPYPGQEPAPLPSNELPFSVYPLPAPLPLNTEPPLNNSECVKNIYKNCNDGGNPSAAELATVLQYLQNLYTGANSTCDFKPDVPICPAITVRKNWKCLTHTEKTRLIAVWQQMYEQGIMLEFLDVNIKWWPAIYKSGELIPHIRRVVYEFDQAMKKIDPRVTLPYWEWWSYAAQAERSHIWHWIGTNGTYADGWCVEDGKLFTGTSYIPCVKRHWSWRGTIYPYAGPEFVTSAIQMAKDYSEFNSRLVTLLDLPLVTIGGYEGQLAWKEASYDVLFFMILAAVSESFVFRWQVQNPANICPLSYNILDIVYNQTTGDIVAPDVLTDTLTSYGTPVREAFWLGYGVNCIVPDNLVQVINALVTNGVDTDVAEAIKRINPYLRGKYFPAFTQLFSRLDHVFETVGQCNAEGLPIPKPTFIQETEPGRKLLRMFINGNDEGGLYVLIQQFISELWYDLSKHRYYSPYITKY